MRARRVLIVAALMLGLWWAPAEGGAQFNCDDFQFQEDAQAQLGGNPGLDGDSDGIACENLPARAAPDTAPPTTSGVIQDPPFIDTVAEPQVTPTTTPSDDSGGSNGDASPRSDGTASPARAVTGSPTLTG